MKNTLFAWLGNTDLKTAESGSRAGPVDMAVRVRNYDTIVLLCNYGKDRWEVYENWFKNEFPGKTLTVCHAKLTSPTNYSEIYENTVKLLESYTRNSSDTNMTFHLSPGTPAMSAVWIIIANSRFPANLIEASAEAGVKDVELPFEISADYIPRLNSSLENRIIGFSESLPPDTPEFGMIIHKSHKMVDAVNLAKRTAQFNVPLLLMGESGTGKELFARAVWSLSSRASGPFIPVNCGAIPATLAESELFGHKKGSFTGAEADRKGKIEAAHGGILFLDEIGELSRDIQVKLLRVIQDKEVYRIGSSVPAKVDFRLVAATNLDLFQEIKAGNFRVDFFHRIAVAVIRLPALRERPEDIKLLTDYYLDEINREFRNQKGWVEKRISSSGRKAMAAYSWPGNVRELVNTLMRMSIWNNGDTFTAKDVEASLFGGDAPSVSVMERPLGEGFSLEALLGDVASGYLEKAMEKSGNNKSKAAELLGFKNYQTLSNWLKRYGRCGNSN